MILYDKAKYLEFYLEENNITLQQFSKMTGISMEDLKGILLHVTVVTEDMALTLAKYTDMKDPDFWIDSKRHY